MKWGRCVLAAAFLGALTGCSSRSDTSACNDSADVVRSVTATLADLNAGTSTVDDIAPALRGEAAQMDSAANEAKSLELRDSLMTAADDIRRLRVDYLESQDTATDGQTLLDDLHQVGPVCDPLLR